MRFATLLALLGLALAPLQNPGNVTFDGIITQAGTTTPLPSVQVRITGTPPGQSRPLTVRTTTDLDGRFHLSAPAAEYALIVQRDGYFGPPMNGVPQPTVSRKLTLAVGQQQPPLSVTLTPGGVITGQIFDSTGLPAGKSTIAAMQVNYRNGLPQLQQVESETSNERGEYRLYWIPPGDYLVAYQIGSAVVATPTVVNTAGQASIEQRTFYPGTLDISKAKVVSVTPGAEIAGINFGVKTAAVLSISGKVVNAPAAGPNTSLLELPGFTLIPHGFSGAGEIVMSTFANSVSQADRTLGLFELRGIPAGQYELFANINSTSFALNYSGRMTVDLTNQSQRDLSISVHPLSEVRGRVVLPAGMSLPEKTTLRLEAAETLPRAGTSQVETVVGANGDFVFKAAMEGVYHINLSLPDNTFVSDILQGNQSRNADGIVKVAATTTEPIQLVVSPSMAHINASVVYPEGKTGIDTTVVLVPDAPFRKNPLRYRTARPDESGRVTITSIAPGTYKIFAWEGVFNTSWLNADFLSKYEDSGMAVTVEPNQNLTGLRINALPLK